MCIYVYSTVSAREIKLKKQSRRKKRKRYRLRMKREVFQTTVILRWVSLSNEHSTASLVSMWNIASTSLSAPSSRRSQADLLPFIDFTDGTTKFFCKIYFVEQFDALRRNCGCEASYIASLANCAKWDSSGGKSGSVFLKTKGKKNWLPVRHQTYNCFYL